MKHSLVVAVVLAVVAGVLSVGVAAAAPTDKEQFNEKFTFTDVDLADETGTVENAVIEAASKQTGGSTLTNCTYFTEGYQEVLGYYQSDAFASSDAETVKSFCIEHFDDRVS